MSFLRPGIIAVLSLVAIVAVFVFAHYDRQAKGYDEAAHRAAQRVQHLIIEQTKSAPGDIAAAPRPIDMEAIRQAGVQMVPEVQMKAMAGPEGFPEAVVVWHPKGIMEYVVSAKGIKTEYQ